MVISYAGPGKLGTAFSDPLVFSFNLAHGSEGNSVFLFHPNETISRVLHLGMSL